MDHKSMKNEVGKQCKKKETRTDKEAAMRSSNASRHAGLNLWGEGERVNLSPKGLGKITTPLNHLSPRADGTGQTYESLARCLMDETTMEQKLF